MSKFFPDLTFVDEYIEEFSESAGQIKVQAGEFLVNEDCRYTDWHHFDLDCWIHKLNVKYNRADYIERLLEYIADSEDEDDKDEEYIRTLRSYIAACQEPAPPEPVYTVSGAWLLLDAPMCLPAQNDDSGNE